MDVLLGCNWFEALKCSMSPLYVIQAHSSLRTASNSAVAEYTSGFV